MPLLQASGSFPAVGRGTWIGLALLLAFYTLLTVWEMATLDATADEPTYFNSGRIIAVEGWEQPITRLHGPIPYYANQLFVGEFPRGGYRVKDDDRGLLLRGRLGTLPFGWLALAVVFAWSLCAFGPRGALVSAGLFALNPLLLAFGGLLAVDMVHTAAVLLCLFLTWRLLVGRDELRASVLLQVVCIGATLGLAFATKYLAVLFAPFVVLATGARVAGLGWRSGRLRALALGLGAALVTTAVAIVALHAAYGFSVATAPHDPAAYESSAVRTLVRLPLVGDVLSTFPAPWLHGVDSQAGVAEKPYRRAYVDGMYAHGEPTYYLRGFLWKTPEPVLLLTLWLLVFRVPRWLLGRGTREETALARFLVPAMLAVGVYLSCFAALQIGFPTCCRSCRSCS